MSEEQTTYKVECYGSNGLMLDFLMHDEEAAAAVEKAAKDRKTAKCDLGGSLNIINFALVVATRITEVKGSGE